MKPLFKIGDKVKQKDGRWTAIVKNVKFDYAYGLGKRTSNKMFLYTLEDDKEHWELMGLWSEHEIVSGEN